MVNETDGSLVPAKVYSAVLYKLHPSFDKRANQSTWPARTHSSYALHVNGIEIVKLCQTIDGLIALHI